MKFGSLSGEPTGCNPVLRNRAELSVPLSEECHRLRYKKVALLDRWRGAAEKITDRSQSRLVDVLQKFMGIFPKFIGPNTVAAVPYAWASVSKAQNAQYSPDIFLEHHMSCALPPRFTFCDLARRHPNLSAE